MALIKAMAGTDRIDVRKRLPGDALWIVSLLVTHTSVVLIGKLGLGVDSRAYWLAWQPGHSMYTAGPMTHNAYLYSPVFAQLIWPLARLPWPVFCAVFTVLPAAGLAWLVAPLGWKRAIPLWLIGTPEMVAGNVCVLLGVVAAVGLRYPATWSFAALTKLTPCLGPVWFAMRREWRQLTKALVATLLIAGISVAISPHLWWQWIRFLTAHAGQSSSSLGVTWLPGLAYRLPVAIALVAWGARTNRRWTLPAGMVLAAPVLWLGTITILMALPRLARDEHTAQPGGQPAASKTEYAVSTP